MANNRRKAERFAREVAEEMARLRGWNEEVPEEVQSDIYRTLSEYEEFYVDSFREGRSPEYVALSIQDSEGDNSGEESIEESEVVTTATRSYNPEENEHAALGLIRKLDALGLIRKLRF